MSDSSPAASLSERPPHSWRELLAMREKARPWSFYVMTALSVGLPVFLGAWYGRSPEGLLASMGGLVILYLPETPFAHRLIKLALCSFGFVVSFAFGVLTSFHPVLSAVTLGLTAMLATFACRSFSVPPPGGFFFVLVASIARTLPFELSRAPERVGLVAFGCMGACLLALAYSVGRDVWFPRAAVAVVRPPDPRVTAILLEAGTIGTFVGGSYLFAQLVGLTNPYWVPISCSAILQGASFRAVWQRKIHRVVGTALGMGLAWIIFSFSPGAWAVAALITLLSFLVESLVARNYGLAVIFITPMTILMADAHAHGAPTELIEARLLDAFIGSAFGLVGGWVIHQSRLFEAAEAYLQRRRAGRP